MRLPRLPTYLLIAIILHVLLGGLSFSVYLGGDILARVDRQVREMLVFTHISREALHRARTARQDDVPALGASDAVPIDSPLAPDIPRQPLDTLMPSNLPLVAIPPAASEQPLAASLATPAMPDIAPPLPEEALATREPLTIPSPNVRSLVEEQVPLADMAPPRDEAPQTVPQALELDAARRETTVTLSPPPPAADAPQTAAQPLAAELPAAALPIASTASDASFPLAAPSAALEALDEAIPLDASPAPEESASPTIAATGALDVPLPRRESSPAAQPPTLPPLPELERPQTSAPLMAALPLDLAPPAVNPSLAQAPLERFGPKAARLLVAQDPIGLTALLQMRHGTAKRDAISAFGGNDQTIAAVERGLGWLARHQHADGYWSLHEFHKMCQGHECSQRGQVASDAAATGLALMCFLGDGHTHQQGNHQGTVKRGLLWLIAQQNEEGDLAHAASGNAHLYSHGIATIALCEALALSRDEQLQQPAERAVAFILAAQHKPTGGWRYQPNQPADTSVVGWQVMALKSAQMAGIDVPAESMQLVRKWLESVERQGNERGRFGYQSRDNSPAMTAEALLCLEYIGVERDHPSLVGGVNFLLERLPREGQETSYYWYYGTQALYHVQGEPWQKWNDSLRDLLLKTQSKDGHLAGTWDIRDQWEQQGGRHYATCLRLLILETYYRHLPLYATGDVR